MPLNRSRRKQADNFKVLIIYVMNPPVSKAIQGAYFVAVLMTGLVFGGGSCLFADVTEGLGCLLGGFCLSMWFLVLKPGGLVTSTAGKAIMISSFTLGAFGLYISHFTRPYGLIGSISFAGATVIVLGVDCFSRAGLKEFWLYLWDLNEDLFPVKYSEPYPITRGIRVEIACTILLCLLGIMSQMKIWKIVKSRRDEKAAAQRKEDERRDLAEENLGRKLEEGNGQELALWEEVYGDKESTKRNHVDSGVGTDEPGSLRKVSIGGAGSREMRDSRTESMAMSNLEGTTNVSSERASMEGVRNDMKMTPVRVAQDKTSQSASEENSSRSLEHPKYLSPPSTGAPATQRLPEAAPKPSVVVSIAEESSAKETGEEERGPKKSGLLPGPKIVPLPFTVPEPSIQDDDDASSIATFAPSEHLPLSSEHLPARFSKGYSGGSILQSLSRGSRRLSRNEVPSEEGLIEDGENDRASSVAATVDSDQDSDDGNTSLRSSKFLSPGTNVVPNPDLRPQPSKNPIHSEEHFDRENRPLSLAKSLVMSSEEQVDHNSVASPEPLDSVSKPARLSRLLPEGTSKVVMAFRTNEWAKHLEAAETPEPPALDGLSRERNSEGVDVVAKEEPAAPLFLQELQQTALTAEPSPIYGERSLENSNRRSASKDQLQDRRQSRPTATPRQSSSGKNTERPVVQPSLQNMQTKKETSNSSALKPTPSQLSLNSRQALRNSSTPVASSPLVGSPIEEGVESSFAPRFTPSPQHLMSHRESMMRNKPSSMSLNQNTSASSLNRNSSSTSLNRNASSTSINRNASSTSIGRNISSASTHPATSSDSLPSQNAALDQDDIPLSQRKSYLQQQQQFSKHPSRHSLLQQSSQQPGRATPTQYAILSSHPNRSSSGPSPRESTLSAWRSSLKVDSPDQEVVQEIEARRSEMLSEKRRASNSQQLSALVDAGRRESGLMDRGMKRSDLQEKHREAMRRMQAGANKHI